MAASKRFTTIQEWAARSALPKRHKQCLLWILATEDPEKSNAPTLVLLAMAGQLGMTKAEVSEVLGVDVYDKLMTLRSRGAVERGTGGTFRLKPNSALLNSAVGVKCHLTPMKGTHDPSEGTHLKPKRTLKKKKIRKTSVQIKSLHNVRARGPAIAGTSVGNRSNTVNSSSSVNVRRTAIADYRPKTKKRNSYSETPSLSPKFREWRPRKPANWKHMECTGYWLHKYKAFYEIEDPQFVGTSARGQNDLTWPIWNFVKHELGLRESPDDWKKYLDWLFDVYYPAATWIDDHPVGLIQVIQLPNGKQNFFLQRFRSRKAKVPKRKKKTKTKVQWHPRGPKYVEVEVD